MPRQNPDFSERTCTDCTHCTKSARGTFGRAVYFCEKSGADCHDERKSGDCGRDGKNWEKVA